MNDDLLLEALRLSSPQYDEEKRKHDQQRQKWERAKTLKGQEWLTEWGAGLLLAENLGLKGENARDAADWVKLNRYDSDGKYNHKIREAIKIGELAAINEHELSLIRANELGKSQRVLIKKDSFIQWAKQIYPTSNWEFNNKHLPDVPKKESTQKVHAEWQAAFDEMAKRKPDLSKSTICVWLAANKFKNVKDTTIRRTVTDERRQKTES